MSELESRGADAKSPAENLVRADSGRGEDDPASSGDDVAVMYDRQMRHIELLRKQRDEARASLERAERELLEMTARYHGASAGQAAMKAERDEAVARAEKAERELEALRHA